MESVRLTLFYTFDTPKITLAQARWIQRLVRLLGLRQADGRVWVWRSLDLGFLLDVACQNGMVLARLSVLGGAEAHALSGMIQRETWHDLWQEIVGHHHYVIQHQHSLALLGMVAIYSGLTEDFAFSQWRQMVPRRLGEDMVAPLQTQAGKLWQVAVRERPICEFHYAIVVPDQELYEALSFRLLYQRHFWLADVARMRLRQQWHNRDDARSLGTVLWSGVDEYVRLIRPLLDGRISHDLLEQEELRWRRACLQLQQKQIEQQYDRANQRMATLSRQLRRVLVVCLASVGLLRWRQRV